MDLRQLRYFVAVAEELSFSRAAVRLHMSQPPLSQHVKTLEDELGVMLLARTRREVKLTDAGRAFLRECHTLLAQAEIASNRVRQVASGGEGTLRLGMATYAIDHVLPAFHQRVHALSPNIQLVVSDMGSEEQVRAIALDRIDLGFVHARIPAAGLVRRQVRQEPFAMVMAKTHPLARKRGLALQDLAGEPMVTFSREHRSALFDALVALCMNAGFSPKLVHVARHPTSLFQIVGLGLGVSIVPFAYARHAPKGLHFREIDVSAGSIQLEAVWRADNPSESMRLVIANILSPDSLPL
jgi:DNA-binding transcriptional LysR family regulator